MVLRVAALGRSQTGILANLPPARHALRSRSKPGRYRVEGDARSCLRPPDGDESRKGCPFSATQICSPRVCSAKSFQPEQGGIDPVKGPDASL